MGAEVTTGVWSVTGLACEVVLFLARAADFLAAGADAFLPLEVVRLAEGAAVFLLLAEAGFAFAAVAFLCAEFDVVAILLVPFHEQLVLGPWCAKQIFQLLRDYGIPIATSFIFRNGSVAPVIS